MRKHPAVASGIILWAAVGAVISTSSLSSANDDAVLLLGALSIFGPSTALVAAIAASREAFRLAGALLVLSALATPTYFAYPVNVLALVGGVALFASRGRVLRPLDGTA